ncbi:MAG TPA: HYR domain-containing protein [Thermoanaerobaculia bacterium]|nr:HYR domain-containing protein [Thermoanaerobaculia bacterium]
MRRILAAVCLMWGATAMMGQVVNSLDPASVPVKSGEWFVTANGRYPGDTFIFDGPAGTFAVEASVVETYFSTGWVPQEVLLKSGTYKVWLSGPSGNTEALDFVVVGAKRFPNLSLVLPEALYDWARDPKGNYVKFDVQAVGGEDPEPRIDCSPGSGEFFYTGSTRVVCTASNSFGEKVSDYFTVSVLDGPPVIKIPSDIWVRPESERGTYVKYDVSAFDEVDSKEVAVKCGPESGSLFAPGVNFVECSASDSAGNSESASFVINVTDEDPPKP